MSGLAGAGLVLQDNAGDDLSVSANGSFTFTRRIASAASYLVTVKTQPTSPSQTCLVTNGAGTITSGNVTDVTVACTTNTYSVGGTVSGLAGAGLVLQDNAGDDLSVAADGTFTFGTSIASGSPYSVSVSAQPSSLAQLCVVTNGTGTVGSGAVTNVSVVCTNTYLLGGTISGLFASGLVLASPGEPDLSVNAGATAFTFATRLPAGSSYAVTVKTQPRGAACTASNASGTAGSADITSVAVSCVRVWTSVAAGRFHGAGLTGDTVWGWGNNAYGQVGDGSTTDRLGPALVGSGFASAAAGYSHTVALKADGTLWAWGENNHGQLGIGTTMGRLVPILVDSGFVSIAAGQYHTVAVKADGTLWAWGWNNHGQVGNGNTTDQLNPVQIDSGFVSAAGGADYTLAVKSDGTLWAWGNDGYGQLGDGGGTDKLRPVSIGSGFTSVSAGGYHTLAVKADGTLWAWGANGSGQLGDGTLASQPSPVPIGSGFTSVSAGGYHTLAVKADGTLWAWGANGSGQLCDGTTTDNHFPLPVGSGFASVAGGVDYSLAVKADGTAWGCGGNAGGQLGDGTTTDRHTPVQIP